MKLLDHFKMPSWKIGPCQTIILFLDKLSTLFKKKKLKNKNIALKIGMEKSYDRMEWDFLTIVLFRSCSRGFRFPQGFPSKCFRLYLFPQGFQSKCFGVYSFGLLNSTKWNPFWKYNMRTKKTETPVSPYLFILGVKALSHMLIKA